MTRDEWNEQALACEECVNPTHHYGKPCFKHKMLYFQLSGAPGLPPSQKPKHGKEQPLRRPEAQNSWERGIVRDERGIPIISPKSGAPMRMKEYSENRHSVDAQVKKLKSATEPLK